MKNTNHLPIEKTLKKHLNKTLKEFRQHRFSESDSKLEKKSSKDFFGFLFKEYDSMNDMVKDIF
ncbi:hypothetical protein C8N26_1486 [Tenacibaculum lutimaris]|uniref:Uncharacterized protein n=1 Tax=Tenacibaculum lutimaris TaxID=285258 RepID=A0A420E1V9_9FLAO|nr:hypothetical protein [Tenacibaculum lutimaris]RKF03857.1 hypothetical protein C8N26_1486 [Tenacibaculum lutimaris]